MSFLYPWFLWSLFLIAIPIIIHLFNFRVYKPVFFSNLDFLKDIKEVSESKSRIKQLIILLLRILAIVSLVLAFSGPYIPLIEKNQTKKEKLLALYLDNSFSMNAQSRYGNIFDAAKERARSIISEYDNKQKFIYTDNNFSTTFSNIMRKEQVLDQVNRSILSPEISKLSNILNRIKQTAKKENKENNFKDIFLISDFQEITSDFDKLKADTNSRVFLIPLSTGKVNNLYIDSVWFNTPQHNLNKAEELQVRIVNAGEEAYQDISIKLFINDKQKAIGSFDIEALSEQTVTLNYVNTQSGTISGKVEISDYPITYDNTFYFSYSISKKTNVLIINAQAQNKYLQALYEANRDFSVNFQYSGNIKPADFANYQVIILDELKEISSGVQQELLQFVQKGGSLVIIPAKEINLAVYNDLFNNLNTNRFLSQDTAKTEIATINYRHFLYKNVFDEIKKRPVLPQLNLHYKTEKNIQNSNTVLLKSSNGDILLTQSNLDKGKYYIFTFPLNTDNTGFYLHPLFVPTMYNIAAYSRYLTELYFTLGKLNPVNVDIKISGDNVLRIIERNGDYEFIPKIITTGRQKIKIDFMNQLTKAGNYFLISGNDTLTGLSFNYNRKESNIQCYTVEEINELIKKYNLHNFSILSANQETFSAEIKNMLADRKNIWKWFVVLALIFLTTEIFVIKLWKE